MNNQFIVILAGGKGERLWPLSRDKSPKQLLSFIDKRSLLELTIDRVSSLVPKQNLGIVTTVAQEQSIKQIVGDSIGFMICEPVGKNTGPAILLACNEIYKNYPDACIAFIPADHYIPDQEKFIQQLNDVFSFCNNDESLVLMGIKPTYPATGYGYIEYDKNDSSLIKRVIRFHEKPKSSIATLYYQDPTMVWNAGIFCGQVKIFIENYRMLAPKLYAAMKAYQEGKKIYEDIESISIDYALMEKNRSIKVLPVDFQWSDVGNLDTFLSLVKTSKKEQKDIISIDSRNNIIHGNDRLAVLVGVENLCVIQTNDILLIVKRDEVEKVKLVLSHLRNKNLMHYL